jgi:adenylate cyclase
VESVSAKKIININLLKKILITLAAGLISFAVCWLISGLQIIESIEKKSYDLRVSRRESGIFASIQAQSHKRCPDIVLVPIDPKALRENPEPLVFWTKQFSEVVKGVVDGGAKVVCLDFHFQISTDEFMRENVESVVDNLNKNRKNKIEPDEYEQFLPVWDKAFAGVLRTGKVVVMCYLNDLGDLILPHEFFTYSAGIDNMGLVNAEPDADGIVRKQILVFADRQKQVYPSFDLLSVSKFTDTKPGYDKASNSITLGDKTIPIGKDNEIIINYLSQDAFSGSPAFSELLHKAEAGDKAFFREHFNNKLVLIGPCYTQSGDLINTPFNVFKSRELYGIEVHANTINTILMNDYMTRATPRVNLLILLGVCLVTAAICFFLKPLHSYILSFVFFVIIFFASFYVMYSSNLWVDMVVPLLAVVVCYGDTFSLRYIFEERKKNMVRKVLGRFVSEPVAAEIMKDPSGLKLGGSRMTVSVLFCDINDFTPMSEKNPPEFIIELLNEYFTRMEKIIFENNGTLKQFTGDEIMVICGAPEPNQDHAMQCAKIAVQMADSLDKWNQERAKNGKIQVQVKFGLHCGEVIAGNVGSPNRTEYAVIGDVVNTASRIMGLTKIAKARILASKDFYEQVKGRVLTESKGEYPVKGRTEQVEVYEIIGLDDE